MATYDKRKGGRGFDDPRPMSAKVGVVKNADGSKVISFYAIILNNNKDFIIANMFHPYDGKPANKSDLAGEYSQVMIRYKSLMNIVVIKL